MKLWYQSLTRLDAWPVYNRVLRDIVDRTRDADTQIDIHGVTRIGGVGDQYRYLEFLETAEVLDNVRRAEAEGYDAFLIGNIADPGLMVAREISSIPILGLCESAIHVACMMGANFSLITINEKFTPRIVENVARAGLMGRMVPPNRMRVERLVDLEAGFTDEAARGRIVAQFNEAAAASEAAGAEVVVAAGGVVMALLAMQEMHQTSGGAVILNGITNLVKMGEFAAKSHRLMGGRFTSKRVTFAPPPPKQIAELRRYYGDDIYPGVQPE